MGCVGRRQMELFFFLTAVSSLPYDCHAGGGPSHDLPLQPFLFPSTQI